MAASALSSGRALCCYRCPTSNSNFVICSDVSVAHQSQPARGDTLTLDWSSSDISVAGVSASKGILCFQDTSNSSYGTCAVLEVSAGVLSNGPKSVVNFGTTGVVAVTALSETETIFCYRGGDALSCSSLTLVGTALNVGSDLALNLERPLEIATAAISSTKIILCWRGASSSSAGKCLLLEIQQASAGPPLQVTSESLGGASWYPSMVALSSKTVAICYQDMVTVNGSSAAVPTAKCNALRVMGMSLDKGNDLLITAGSAIPGADDFSIARLSDVLGVVCYHGGLVSHYTTCNSLNLFGNTLAKGPDLVMHEGGAASNSMSRLSESSVLLCYRSSPASGEKGICNVIRAQVIQSTTTAIWSSTSEAAVNKGNTNDVGNRYSTSTCILVLLLWASTTNVAS